MSERNGLIYLKTPKGENYNLGYSTQEDYHLEYKRERISQARKKKKNKNSAILTLL